MSSLKKIVLDNTFLEELDMGLLSIENVLKTAIDHDDANQVAHQLAEASQHLHITGRLIEIATRNYDRAKAYGVMAVIEDVRTKGLSVTLQTKLVEGLIADYGAQYQKTERVIKSLSVYIDGLRSLNSLNKENKVSERFNQG